MAGHVLSSTYIVALSTKVTRRRCPPCSTTATTGTDRGGACAVALGASSVIAWYCFTDYAWAGEPFAPLGTTNKAWKGATSIVWASWVARWLVASLVVTVGACSWWSTADRGGPMWAFR
jgi:hypothetical protein